jgi:hypothetical protein
MAKVWKDLILESTTAAPESLLANPLNARIHPREQQDIVAGLLDAAGGWVRRVLVNRRSSPSWPAGERGVETVLDGHLRVGLAISRGEASVPVDVVDLDPAAEALLLRTLDPVAGLAGTDRENSLALLERCATDDPAVMAFLAALGEGDLPPIEPYEEPGGAGEGEGEGMEDFVISIAVPVKMREAVEEWIANGERRTAPGFGLGIMRRAGLLDVPGEAAPA